MNSYMYQETSITLGDILASILASMPEPGPTKSSKRRAKIYNKAIDDAIEAVRKYYVGRGYTASAGWAMVSDLEALKKSV